MSRTTFYDPRRSPVAALLLAVAITTLTAIAFLPGLWMVGLALAVAAALARGSATEVRVCVGVVGILAALLGGLLLADLFLGYARLST